MVAPAATSPSRPLSDQLAHLRTAAAWLPVLVAAAAFVLLFANPTSTLVHDWLHDKDAGHGLLLFPVSLWLAWRAGIRVDSTPSRAWGVLILIVAVLVRAVGALASEFFSQRLSIWIAILGLVVYAFGWKQVRNWWLPLVLLVLSIPLPALLTNRFAIPLQFEASKLGTALIHWRRIPSVTAGNVIVIPEAQLFVAEACSGLRSLSALVALGVMIGGMYLRTVPGRVAVLLLAVPLAVLLNGVRIFLTAFLMHFVDPALGQGFMHESEGFGMFAIALVCLGVIAGVVRMIERKTARTND